MGEETESERRRSRELEELKREAEHSNLAKSRVLAAASHDVRQPLHALGLFAQQLRGEVRETRARATLERLDRSLGALGQMLGRLFDMSKIESRNIEPDVEVFELGALLERVADEFEETARAKGLQLVIEPSTFTVTSDLTLLGRILQNFIANAIQYTDAGEIRVETHRRGASVRIEVHDSGIGIPEEKQGAVFDEFVRLDASRGEGLGLGLSIVSGLAKLLAHEVGIEASPLGGTCFYVSVPIALSVEETRDSMLPLANLGLDGHLVAVIDDDLAVLEGMRALIESWGCEVLVAQDSEDLLAGLESRGRAPEILLADYRLANGATGIQAIEEMRERWGSDLAALVITGETSRETADELRRNGLIHLTKPVPPHKLRAVLLELMRDAA
jgi:CheY-like chemotaxis protein/anti-sigma regulatory factor (Ser/Thr protein kinase)